MDKKRVDFSKFEIVESGAKFYKAVDSNEGFYHVCDDYAPDGSYRLEYMPEIYKHDISVSLCALEYKNGKKTAYRQHIKFCPICGKKLEY